MRINIDKLSSRITYFLPQPVDTFVLFVLTRMLRLAIQE
jgi:hypothetical protein